MTLTGLEGVKQKTVECKLFTKVGELKKIIESGFAATTADTNGAINIWMDDNNILRGEALRNFYTINSATFKSFSELKVWAKEWITKIK